MENWNGTSGFAQYSNFQVANEDLNYKILVNGFSGNVSYDAMDNDNGYFFSTYDRDNDADLAESCAETRHSGWWHKKCTRANLNGKYQFGWGKEERNILGALS
ncbi:angiopoietin-related protein 7-like [Pecten maximus]|uniref:angiopoietin-related protein 7-like n=1 Tax=Pecten maximus TaxID=6579 RepID=UPI0014588A59|nr:angiopoietin-related protein 7-like [Pecten maximus]